MASHLDAFSVRVYKRRAKTPYKLGSFDNSGSDLLWFLDRFLSGLDVTTSHDQRYSGLLMVRDHRADLEKRTVTGTLLAGHYGKTSSFFDIYTSDNVFSRMRRHAEALSFYFKGFLPSDQDEGIILMQRIGNSSPFRPCWYFLSNLFRENYPGLVLKLNPLVNREELDALLRRSVTNQIRILDFHLHGRVEEIHDRGFHEEVAANLVINQRANEKRNMMKDIVRSLAETRRTGIAELDEHISDESKIKITIEEDGRERSIDLNTPRMRLSVEVDEMPEGADQAEYRKYLDKAANEFMKEVAARIWGERSGVWQH